MARVAFRAGLTSAHRSQPCSVRGCPAATSLATRAWWHEGKREADRRAGAFADVNKQQADGLTPLMDAALAGDVDLVRALIARGAAVEPPKPEGMPRHWQLRRDGPLRAAVHARSPEAVREILAAGADPNACGDDGSTPIPAATLLLAPLEAEACNRLRSVFVERCRSPAFEDWLAAWTEAANATAKQDADYAERERHRRVSARQRGPGCSGDGAGVPPHEVVEAYLAAALEDLEPLDRAVLQRHLAVVEALLAAGSGAGTPPGAWVREPPLLASLSRGSLLAAAALLRASAGRSRPGLDGRLPSGAAANVSERGPNLETPLAVACQRGLRAFVPWLLAMGADPNSDDRLGQTPVAIAVEAGDAGVVRALLAAGGDVGTARGRGGGTLLHWGLNRGAVGGDMLQVLMGAGCEANARDAAGDTALLCAARAGQGAAARALVVAGADVGAATGTGMTALHLACDRGDEDLARLLLSHGADPHARDSRGRTPVDLAREAPLGKGQSLVALLVAHGASAEGGGRVQDSRYVGDPWSGS